MVAMSEYSMLSTTSTTLILGMLFLFLARQNNKQYMGLWGVCWLLYSVMFLIDFFRLSGTLLNESYIEERQAVSLLGALLFLRATYYFFHLKMPRYIYFIVAASLFSILLAQVINGFYGLILVPIILVTAIMMIWAGCLFITYTWTQNLPEKYIAGFLTILWAVYSNQYYAQSHIGIAVYNYYIGLFTANLLILFLMIIHFKKTRFLFVKREEQYRLLVENASDSMFLFSYKSRIFRYMSPSTGPMLGIPTPILSLSPERFFEKVGIDSDSKHLINMFDSPLVSSANAVLCLRENGRGLRWSELHASPIYDAFGVITAVEGILRDITERKLIEESLRDSEMARKELIENISHELRTPITLIQGYLESMLNDVIPASSIPVYLKMIHAKTMTLNSLLDDLIQVSHFTSQTLEYRFYELEAKQYFSEIIGQMEFQVRRSGKYFFYDNRLDNNMIVIIDPSRIEQIILNLISNSIRHTPEGGEIQIECYNIPEEGDNFCDDSHTIPGGEIIFRVTDTGNGIPTDDLPHLFERKFRGKNNSDPALEYGGLGLGLFISMQIIKQHSGKIWAENNPQGGARFSFAIPYYKA